MMNEPTYIPPTNFIRANEYEGPIGPVIADEEMIDNLNPQLEHENRVACKCYEEM
jgi:hypothetical protein